MKALIRVKKTYRPNSRSFIGVRIQACVPNLAARRMLPTEEGFRATRVAVPAFVGSYLICESGDYGYVQLADFERFQERLAWEGFTEVEMLTGMNGERLKDMLPEEVRELTASFQNLIDKKKGNK